jgi:hypothetical protein
MVLDGAYDEVEGRPPGDPTADPDSGELQREKR